MVKHEYGMAYLTSLGIYTTPITPDAAQVLRKRDDVLNYWKFSTTLRSTLYTLVVELLASGIARTDVQELIDRWQLTDAECASWCASIGAQYYTDEGTVFAHTNSFVNLQESPCGVSNDSIGNDLIGAMASLLIELGYKPGKRGNRESATNLIWKSNHYYLLHDTPPKKREVANAKSTDA